MDDVLTPAALTVDLRRNTIDIAVDARAAGGPEEPERHLLEMGVRGRLLGIELDDAYLMVCAPSDDDAGLVRAIEVVVGVRRDASGHVAQVSVPRHGAGYEITFPSGNQ